MRRSRTKLLALGISISLCAAALSGCGGKDTEPAVKTQESTQTQESADTQESTDTQEVTDTEEPVSPQTPEAIEVTTFPLPDGPEESEIFIEPIADISDDFIRGMDASAVLVEENSGVKYYGYDGEEQDVFKTLAQSGVNYIRIRVWNEGMY